MKSRVTTLFLTLAACHLAAAVVLAQEPRTQDSPGLGLQIFNGNNQQPSYASAPVGGGETIWFSNFKRLPAWRDPEGVLPIKAVRLLRQTKGERVYVRFTVHRGLKFYETEEFVAEYEAASGEGFTVNELKNFGIEPFRFKVVRAEEVAAPELGVRNLTHSIEVVSAEVRAGKTPHVRFLLRNLSSKRVMSLKLETVRGGRPLSTGWPVGAEGRALIEPGALYENKFTLGSAGAETPGGYVPLTPDGVLVASAFFSDGSYEGEIEPAVSAAARYAGYRIQLTRLLSLIREALDAPEAKDSTAASEFKEKVRALESNADSATVEEVFQAFPGLEGQQRASIKSDIELAMNWLRRDELAALAHVERKGTGAEGGAYFRAWLKGRLDKFEQWLGRLSR